MGFTNMGFTKNGIHEEGSRFTVQGAGNTKELKKILDARLGGHDASVQGVGFTEKPSVRGYRDPWAVGRVPFFIPSAR